LLVLFQVESANVGLEPSDRWGFTPLAEAQRFGHKEVAEIVEKAIGAKTY